MKATNIIFDHLKKNILIVVLIVSSFGMQAQDGFNALSNNENWIANERYDISGQVIVRSVSYFDELGKVIQNQTKDIETDRIWATQTLYDAQGRPALISLGAPIGLSFGLTNAFILKSDGTPYSLTDFDASEAVVGTQANSLGWYYSENNTNELYQDATNHPFSRTIYDELNPGNVLKSVGGNKVEVDGQEQWVNGFAYTVPAAQELYYAFGREYFPEGKDKTIAQYGNDATLVAAFDDVNKQVVTLMAYKSVAIDVHGNETVAFTNGEGQGLAGARSGEGTQKQVVSLVGDQGFVDIHLPKGCDGTLTYLGSVSDYKVYNLRTGLEVTTGLSVLSAGVYRIQAITPNRRAPLAYIDKTTGNIEPVYSDAQGVRYNVNYYDHSLNYYDDTGRLTASLQPIGFDNDYTLNQTAPNHVEGLKSTYEYDVQGQLIHSTSPDEGEAWFKYRRDGQIRYSQNSKQLAAGEFSYTNYDQWGRPIESGVLISTAFSTADLDAALPAGTRKEQFQSVYDYIDNVRTDLGQVASSKTLTAALAEGGFDVAGYNANVYTPKFSAGNVVATYSKNPETTTTWYSYDVYGRVAWVVQYINGLGTKTIDYEYDPITGSVTKVCYQKYKSDERFIHKYTYNSVNQLTKVETSTDDINFTEHAAYTYYENGTLKRKELAGGIQGIDYVYNLQGALKSINHPSLDGSMDPGGDTNDLFGMAIDYHNKDYKRNRSNIESTDFGTPQLNGNIKSIRWNNGYQPLANAENTYSYIYDRNNWLTNAQYGTYTTPTGTPLDTDITSTAVFTNGQTETQQASNSVTWLPGFHAQEGSDVSAQVINNTGFEQQNGDYDVTGITYDANGNIQTLNRNKHTDNGSNAMDQLSYTYKNDKPNQLDHVIDAAGQVINEDIGTQNAGNYVYNEIGQLVNNQAEGITYLYNASGLVTEVQKNNVPVVKFFYNDKGFRVKKHTFDAQGILIDETFYIRDATGTALVVYNNGNIEHTIYGADRLGVYSRLGDYTNYQLTDHLGNVRAVIRMYNNNLEVTNASDYYPFGMIMPNRHLTDGEYRYAFQGQEKDPETGKEAFQLRLWDARIGRWLTTDPYGQHDSPYLGMGNAPVLNIDPDGGRDIRFDSDGNIILNEEGGIYFNDNFFHNLWFGTRGQYDDGEGGWTTFEIADDDHITQIEDGVIDRIQMVSTEQVRQLLAGAGIYGQDAQDDPIDFFLKNGVGFQSLDFANNSTGAGIASMFDDVSSSLFILDKPLLAGGGFIGFDDSNFGNFLVGSGAMAVGIPVGITQIGAHLNSLGLVPGANNGYEAQLDSLDDQRAIKLGAWYTIAYKLNK